MRELRNAGNDGSTAEGGPPLTPHDIDAYSARMLLDLERIAQAQQHHVLAQLLHLAAAEARRLQAQTRPQPETQPPRDNKGF